MHATALQTLPRNTPPATIGARPPRRVTAADRRPADHAPIRGDESAWARQAQASNGFGGF